MRRNIQPIIIRRMKPGEQEQVSHFVGETMRKHYHCEPYELPKLAFIALRGDDVVGAMALSASGGQPLPLETIYALDYGAFPEIFDRSRVVQLGRWVATAPEISEALVYASVRHAIEMKCEWGIGEVKPKIVRRFTRMGIRVIRIPGEPILVNIPADVLPYYLLPPKPAPCVLSLRDALGALEKKVTWLIAQNKIIMHSF